jgi:hypothetical protein
MLSGHTAKAAESYAEMFGRDPDSARSDVLGNQANKNDREDLISRASKRWMERHENDSQLSDIDGLRGISKEIAVSRFSIKGAVEYSSNIIVFPISSDQHL